MLLKHSAIYSASNLINGLIGFAAVALNTRLLGADEYGHYALALSTAMLASTVFFEWLRLSVMRFSEAQDGARILSTSLTLYIGGGAIILSLAAILFVIQLDGYFPAFGWVAVGLFAVCVGFTDLFLGLARASLRPSLYFAMQIMRGALALVLGGLAAWIGYGFAGLLIGMAAANVLTILFGFMRYPTWQTLRPSTPDKDSVKTLMQFGLPIVLTIAAMQVMLVLDRYTLSYFHGAAAVGAYAAANDITQKLIIMLGVGINMAAYNLTMQAFEREGKAAAEARVGTTLIIVLSIITPVAAGIALVADPLGHLLLGANVAGEAVRLMPLLSFVAVLQAIRTYYLEQPYHILKITHGMFLPYVIGGCVAMASWIMFVPSEGAKGIAYGLILGHMTAAFLTAQGIWKKFSFSVPWKSIGIIACALGLMAVMVGGMPWPEGNIWLFIRVAVGGLTYASVLFAANLLDARTVILKKLKVI